jgi:DNA (cytosine-5)-methyltransferase 1
MSTTVCIGTNQMTTTVVKHKGLAGVRLAEFFAGIGLARLALERHGCRTVFANDISADKFEIYRQNFEVSGFVLGDIRNINPSAVPHCDLATACFPCTDISVAGERSGLAGEESGTFWGFIGLLKAKRQRPPVVLIENVEGLLTSNGSRDFRAVISALNGLGYACDAWLLDARAFVPQSRRRVLILGRAIKLIKAMARALPQESWARPPILLKAIRQNSDLNWSFQSVPTSSPTRCLQLADVIEEIAKDNPTWWDGSRVEKLLEQMDFDHRKAVDFAVGQREVSYLTVYRRTRGNGPRAEVRGDGVAGCLRTARGGSSRQILLVAGQRELKVRFMSAREYARLQGVPDTFTLNTTATKALFGMGDAVCVPMIEWIAVNCLSPLFQSESLGTEENRACSPRRVPGGAVPSVSAPA